MKCVLHIGTEKTGTTLLQDWLYDNRKNLGKQRVFLSTMLGTTNNRLLPVYFQHDLDDWARMNGIETTEQKEAYFEGFLDRFKAEVAEASKSHDVFVITSEHFHSRLTQIEGIIALSEFLNEVFSEVQVICYFRNQFDMAVSFYSTLLLVSPSDAPLNEFINSAHPQNCYYNFLEIADNWSAAFGQKNCEFRVFDRTRFLEGDLRKDFIRFVSDQVELDCLDYKIESSNVSLRALESAAYRAVNHVIPYWNKEDGKISFLNQEVKRSLSDLEILKKGRIQSDVRTDVEQAFDQSNSEFFSKYFGCGNLFVTETSSSRSDVTFTLQEVQDIVFQSLSAALGFTQGVQVPDSNADWLRDLAIKIEHKDKLGLEDALKLMRLAQVVRPEGPLISIKIDEYEKRLKLEASSDE